MSLSSTSFSYQVLTPEAVLLSGTCTSITAPGSMGYMMILPGHARMVSELDVGELTVIDSSGVKKTFFVAGGFIDVDQSVTKVLVDIAESPEGIDRTRATSALDRAKKRLEAKKHLGGDIEEIDHARALAAFKRAEVRLSLSQR